MFILDACSNISVLGAILFFKKLVHIISIVVPILLVLLISIDLAKAVMASSDDDMKRAQSLAIKRIIAGLLVFFVPLIVDTAFTTLSDKGVSGLTCYENASDEVISPLIEADRANLELKESERLKLIEETKKSNASAKEYIKSLQASRANGSSSSSSNGQTVSPSGLSFRNKNVLILGDSITSGYGKYPQVAIKSLGGKVKNKAKGSMTISYVGKSKAAGTNSMLYMLKNNSWFSTSNLKKYPYVVIAAGTNDYAWSSITPSILQRDMGEVLSLLRQGNSDSKIIIITPLRRWTNDNKEKTGVLKYSNAMKAAAQNYGNMYIVNGESLVTTSEYKYFPKDSSNGRLHPNASFAKTTIAQRLVTELQKL